MRTYSDFARRSPIPRRDDGRTTSARNSPPLVNASLPRPGGPIFHFDGEFPSLVSLIEGTIAGRNFGWLPGERARAVAHVARVLREDDGSGELAGEFGGAYRDVLAGAPGVPPEFVLPETFRIDVDAASDQQIFDAVAALIAAYVEQLEFARDARGANDGSPYDRFLELNRIPRKPSRGQSVDQYTDMLRQRVAALREPVYVEDGPFEFHDQDRTFGPLELAGLRLFLAKSGSHATDRDLRAGGAGNCAACHPAPNFTDFSLHNTGVTQAEYDRIHGAGAFARVFVPSLDERRRNPDAWLPATELHPHTAEPFRRPADASDLEHTDLGAWNIFANPDFPEPQAKLASLLCREQLGRAQTKTGADFGAIARLCRPERLLAASLARFKTAGLRDLGHSAPYFHNGQFDRFDEVLRFYRDASQLARAGRLRNGDPEIARIAIDEKDFAALSAFLRALNEDYQ